MVKEGEMTETRKPFPVRAYMNILLATAIVGLLPMIISGDWDWVMV